MKTIIQDNTNEPKDILTFEGLYIPNPNGTIKHYGGVDNPRQILIISNIEDKTCGLNGIIRTIHVIVSN